MPIHPSPKRSPETVGMMLYRFIRDYWLLRREGVTGAILSQRFGKLLHRSELTIDEVCETEPFKGVHRIMAKRGNQAFYPLDAWKRFTIEEQALLTFAHDNPRKDVKKLRRETSQPDGGYKWTSAPKSISMRDFDKE